MGLLYEPTKLTENEKELIEKELGEFQERLNQEVDQVLKKLPDEELRAQVKLVCFTENNLLPKRKVRPLVKPIFLAYNLHLAVAGTKKSPELRNLLQFAALFIEYTDIMDDVFDGDVKNDNEWEVVFTASAIVPIIISKLANLGKKAMNYASKHALRMTKSTFYEVTSKPTKENFLKSLQFKSLMFGIITGLSAVVAGGDEELIKKYQNIGCTYFKYDYMLLDLLQSDEESIKEWNAWHIFDEKEIISRMHTWENEIGKQIKNLPPKYREVIKLIISKDLSEI